MADPIIQCDEPTAPNLQSRVKSFPSDPLHSVAYLQNLVAYLNGKFLKPKHHSGFTSNKPEHNFLYSYSLTHPRPSLPIIYAKVEDFLERPPNDGDAEIIFLTGYPSPEWLQAILSRFELDHRFLYRHLEFLPTGQRDWYTSPDVPSRSQQFIRLLIPSIIFIGPEGRSITANELHEARISCAKQLRHQFKSFFGGLSIWPGQSIVRQVNIHSGDTIVLEQVISITSVTKGQTTKIIVWSDAGQDENFVYIPQTKSFQTLSGSLEYCPVFFEKDLEEYHYAASADAERNRPQRTKQPLSILPSRYGETLDWINLPDDPLLALQELLQFQSAAAMQYLNMLRKLSIDLIARTRPTGDAQPTMEDILHFEYTKTVLVRWSAHFQNLLQCLDSGPISTGSPMDQGTKLRDRANLLMKRDFEFLKSEADMLANLCDSGKSTIMSSFTVWESRRAAEESRLVTKLTQATNRITFIFLPISYVTSIFGMNFKQFGQGPLSITVWVAITVPMLTLCVLLNEYGGLFVRFCKRSSSSTGKKS